MDPFDLPEWLGTEPVTWTATMSLAEGPRVTGQLTSPSGQVQPLDLLACDSAYPTPALGEDERRRAHQAWQFGEVLLVACDGRATAAMPGSGFDANSACEVVSRFAKAVGAAASRYTVAVAL
ncbi:MAG: hypothetical protein WKF76_00205 [Nocardioidaceae bacterium]